VLVLKNSSYLLLSSLLLQNFDPDDVIQYGFLSSFYILITDVNNWVVRTQNPNTFENKKCLQVLLLNNRKFLKL